MSIGTILILTSNSKHVLTAIVPQSGADFGGEGGGLSMTDFCIWATSASIRGEIAFFWGALPTQNYFGAKGAFRKILGSVTKNGYLKIVQRGDPLGRQGLILGAVTKKACVNFLSCLKVQVLWVHSREDSLHLQWGGWG